MRAVSCTVDFGRRLSAVQKWVARLRTAQECGGAEEARRIQAVESARFSPPRRTRWQSGLIKRHNGQPVMADGENKHVDVVSFVVRADLRGDRGGLRNGVGVVDTAPVRWQRPHAGNRGGDPARSIRLSES